jgi:hypothetical protein
VKGDECRHSNEDVAALLIFINSDPVTDVMVTIETGNGREGIYIPYLKPIIDYTRSMGGVHFTGQKRILWTQVDICFILNVAIVNSITFYDKVNGNACTSHNTQLQYKANKAGEEKFSSLKTVERKK